MINKSDMKNILVMTITFILMVICIYVLSMTYSISKVKYNNYYTLGNDKIPSVYNVLGKRKLYYYKSNKKENIETNIYKYKDIKNIKSDLTRYYETLKNNNFINTTKVDLSKENGLFKISNYSVDENKIIIIEISYNKNSYTIKISKGEGIINLY